MDKVFLSLKDEASFTSEILKTGVTQIRKANYMCKGKYFESFSSLSIGLERISKLCILLDYRLSYGNYPNTNYMKREIGHDLKKLYDISKDIIKDREYQFDYLSNLDDIIYQNILEVLSDFSKGDRYANIDFITDNNSVKDPICDWSNNVDSWLFKNLVSDRKKKKIKDNAKIIEERSFGSILTHIIDEQKETINSIFEASLLTGKIETISKYRQLYILHIIRYWVELLIKLQDEAYSLLDIPYFSEFYAIFYNDDSYLKMRKDFTLGY